MVGITRSKVIFVETHHFGIFLEISLNMKFQYIAIYCNITKPASNSEISQHFKSIYFIVARVCQGIKDKKNHTKPELSLAERPEDLPECQAKILAAEERRPPAVSIRSTLSRKMSSRGNRHLVAGQTFDT